MYKLKRPIIPTRAQVSIDSLVVCKVRDGEDLATGRYDIISNSPYVNLAKDYVISRATTRRQTVNNRLPKFLYAQVVEGSPPPTEPPIDEKTLEERASNGKKWKEAKKTGDIVMAPYAKIQTILRFEFGEKVVNTISAASIGTDASAISAGTLRGERLFVNSSSRVFWSFGALLPAEVVSIEVIDPRQHGWAITASQLAHDVAANPPAPDTGLCTSALAEANTGAMDVLTNLAELPETIEMILNGIGSVFKLTKAARNKEFRLTKNHRDRVKSLRDKFNKKIASIDRRINNVNSRRSGAPAYLQRLLDQKKQTLARLKESEAKAFNRTLAAESKNFIDATANVWMLWRYGIMPIKYSIDDGLDMLANWFTDYVTTRDKMSDSDISFTVPSGFSGVDSWESLHRIVIKRRYTLSEDVYSRLLQVGSMNLAVSALELVKRSFVLGWFVNLGDALSAFTSVPVHDEQACSYVNKVDVTETYIGPYGCKVHLVVRAYRRRIIDPLDYAGLCFDPYITLFRGFDSIAMLWPTIKKNFLSNKGK